MRSRILAVAGISAAALAAAAAFAGTAGTAGAQSTGAALTQHATVAAHQTPAKKGSCYSLTTDDSGTAVTSANYSDEPTLDGGGATDFSLTAKCKVKTVIAQGQYYNGSGPASGFDVTFYKDKKGLPGKVVNTQTEQSYTGGSGDTAFTITLGSKVKLKKGNYFVSVLADMTLSAGGQWGWELSTDSSGTVNPDLWENPQNGFGTGCTTWEDVETCVGYGNTWMVTIN